MALALRSLPLGEKAAVIGEVVDGLAANGSDANGAVEARVKLDVLELTNRFPIY